MGIPRFFAWCLVHCVPFLCYVNTLFCESPQLVELEKTGIISCAVDENYFGIYWYNSSESRKNTPLLSLEGSTFGGAVYPSDEFQLLENGSLSITEVTLQHDHIFRIVLVVNKELGLIEKRDIQVVVIVKPLQNHPLINHCGTNRGCTIHLNSITDLKCAVSEVRPAPNLKWFLRTASEDIEYTSNSSVSHEGKLFSAMSEITTQFLNSTVLLLCKAIVPPPLLMYSESFILIETSNHDEPLTEKTSINVELGSPIILKCGTNDTVFIKWERKYKSAKYEPIAFAVLGQPFFSSIYIDEWEVQMYGSLMKDAITANDEGTVSCLTGDGNIIERTTFSITVFAYPHPAAPVIEGCDYNSLCLLEINSQGSIKCSLYGIRPLVTPEWVILTDISHETVKLQSNQYNTTNYDNGTFDVHLTSELSVLQTSQDTLSVACKVKIFEKVLSNSVDLLIIDDQTPSTTVSPDDKVKFHLLWITVPFVCVVIAGLLFISKTVTDRRTKTTTTPVNDQEMAPMMEADEAYVQAKVASEPYKEEQVEQPPPYKYKENVNLKEVFIKQLQNKYKLQYDSVRPIPYIRDKMYNVKNIFVESTIEALMLNGQLGDSDAGSWEKLNNYHQLLKFDSSHSSRKIVQGDPGYGKSTLSLQMAYDWSTNQNYSPLCEKEFLILLRLRQLFGVTSIYKAIRLFLLPRDTTINESDIKDILQKSSSAVVILDGFDEYPHQDGENVTDVNRIIAGDMFQEFHVIVCTRPLSLPGQIPPRTQRTRLNGFDKMAQELYIQKAVTNNAEVAEKIHARLGENPVLADFCQVPLFFVMFAHMTKENEKFQAVNSATSFFRHVITCFHSHLQNKVTDENVKHYKIFESDHTKLDELSFQVLSNNQEITLRKDELRKHIGEQFYDYYVRLGILCEEEIFDSSIDEVSSEISPYRVDVHFYHKLFCEWYAAHHLSQLAENTNFLKLKKLLRKLDLFELHYVFRFACGLNAAAARKILKHLNTVKDGEKLAILCILEQTGKFIDIKENVSQLCSEVIHLCRDDSRVLHRSTIQLMIIASRNEVPISSVWLKNCLNSVDVSGEYLRLNTELSIPRLDTMIELHIYSEGVEMTLTDVTNIIKFATLSRKIEEVRFHLCVLPWSLDNQPVLKHLDERDIKVSWAPDPFTTFFLDSRGLWEDKDGSKLNKSAYQKQIFKTEI